MLLKTAGETRGNPDESGTGYVIYQRQQKVREDKHYLGGNITKSAAEYISIILGLKAV